MDAAIRIFEKDGFPFDRCTWCGLVTRGGDAGPPSYHDYLPALTQLLPPITRLRYEALLARLARGRAPGRFLDVGCGGGFLVEIAGGLGWEAEGTEVSHAACEFARARGLKVHEGVIADARLKAESFDAITLMEVVEHVPSPVALLAECAALLRPGGVLYLTTPNWNSLSRRVLGERWSAVSRDHVVYFTPKHVRRALRDAGLTPRDVTTANVQPHELMTVFRRAKPEGNPMARTMALRDTVERNLFLRGAKAVVNACLDLTGTGDTIRALAER